VLLVNARIAEYPEKVSQASAFLSVLHCVSPASAFLHQDQHGIAGHAFVRHSPAMAAALHLLESLFFSMKLSLTTDILRKGLSAELIFFLQKDNLTEFITGLS
jgi:hypothetical protein